MTTPMQTETTLYPTTIKKCTIWTIRNQSRTGNSLGLYQIEADGWPVLIANIADSNDMNVNRPNADKVADRLVRVCNSHDALVEATQCAKEFIESMKGCIPDWREHMKISDEGYTAKLDAALHLAQGQD